MTIEQIERFLTGKPTNSNHCSRISFKTRSTFEGMFIQATDYSELKQKNFWRIVAVSRIEEYLQSKDINLSRIFNGSEFTKLALSN